MDDMWSNEIHVCGTGEDQTHTECVVDIYGGHSAWKGKLHL